MGRKTKSQPAVNARYLRDPALCTYLSCGRSTARQIAEQAGAVIKIGGTRLTDLEKLDTFLAEQAAGDCVPADAMESGEGKGG